MKHPLLELPEYDPASLSKKDNEISDADNRIADIFELELLRRFGKEVGTPLMYSLEKRILACLPLQLIFEAEWEEDDEAREEDVILLFMRRRKDDALILIPFEEVGQEDPNDYVLDEPTLKLVRALEKDLAETQGNAS